MEINNKTVKAIRPITEEEWSEYSRNRDPINIKKPLFCIVMDDNSIIYPKFDCIKCMQEDKCLFSLANKIP